MNSLSVWAGQVIEGWKNDEESRGTHSTSRSLSFATRQATFLSTQGTGTESYGFGQNTTATGRSATTGLYSSGSSGLDEDIVLKEIKPRELLVNEREG